MDSSQAPLTQLLQQSLAGDQQAAAQVWDQLHDQLRVIAKMRLQREYGVTPLQPTELVHEAYMKLCGSALKPADRTHFLALAANAMRQVLVDQARYQQRQKRGAGQAPVTLDSQWIDPSAHGPADMLALDQAMDALATMDARKATVVELSYFGGMTVPEMADYLNTSQSTVKRDLRTARAFLASGLI
ncbi:MAG: DNA-directed RNA polymerase sigma-70 factor [Lysobacteraceae bacterium]|nr:MAG: DNA-directed RNA polymerase sigma-70 factor [Xanthomonadaceae bacterium]